VSSGYSGGWTSSSTAPSGWFYISRSSDRSTAPGIDVFATQYAIDNPENVSAPALLGLMGLGLFGFAARRRNAK
jgi:MYXO-CTERM domain-containing protein